MTNEAIEALKEQVDEYENNLRRILVNEGVQLEALEQQIADPKGHVDVILQMVSAVTGIPKRILVGSERGELSSTQDEGEWVAWVNARRDEHAEPHILRPLIDRLIELKVLPKVTEYVVKWQDLFALSEKDRVDIGRFRSEALRNYANNPVIERLITPEVFFKYFLGLTPEERQDVQRSLEEHMNQEPIITSEEEEMLNTSPVAKE
jgi:hypothetical protein